MRPSIPARRIGAAALGGVLAGGLLLAPPAHAGASLGLTQVQSQVQFDDNPEAGVTCTQTGPGDVTSPPVTFAADGVPVTSSASSSAVITDNANASDHTALSGSVTHTVTATQANGGLSRVHIATNATTSVTTNISATKCHGSVGAGGATMFQFNLDAPTLVTISAETHRMFGAVEAGSLMGPSQDAQAVVAYVLGAHGVSSGSVVLPAGTAYVGISEVQKELEAPATAGTVSSTGDLTVDLTFAVPGSASSVQSGAGGKYVTLAAGRDCGAGKLAMTWTKKAGKGKHRVVKKAIVKVDGAKVATIKKPKKGQVSTVSGLNPERAAAVEVVVKVKGEGASSTERSYLRCT